MKDSIEIEFGGELEWERMSDKVTCRIKQELSSVSYFDKDDWDKMYVFLIDCSVRMEKAFRVPIKKLNKYAKQ